MISLSRLLFFLFVIITGFDMSESSMNLLRREKASTPTNIFAKFRNLTSITWAHAVNNSSYLEECLDSDIEMLEADIVMGYLVGTTTEIPIMGHPPETTSDLSLAQFLNRVQEHNNNNNNKTTNIKKGIKLDFKTIEVFEASLQTLLQLWEDIDFPVWLNADIITGPLNATTKPVDPSRFFAGSSDFSKAILSIGWTTNYGGNIKNALYTKEHIRSMISVINESQPTQEITFPVRAGIAAESLDNIEHLLKNVPNSTLTVWSSAGDAVNITKLRTLILTIGVEFVYLDVPEEISNELDLSSIAVHFGSFQTLSLLIIASFVFGLLL